MTQAIKTLGVVLSGGAGIRVGGQDKGLLPYRGRAIVQHVLTALAPQVDQTLISIHRNEDQYRKFGFPLAIDSDVSHEGPLMGVVSAINQAALLPELSKVSYFVLAPCDVPHLPVQYVEHLIKALRANNADCAVSHDGARRQNLHCLFSAKSTKSLLEFYQDGGRAMHHWFRSVRSVDVDFSASPSAFENLNTLDQLNLQS